MHPQSKGVGTELTRGGLPAMAHTMARILWHLLKFNVPFKPEVFVQAEAQ